MKQTHRYVSGQDSVSTIVDQVAALCQELGVPATPTHDLSVTTAEAVTNVFRHAYKNESGHPLQLIFAHNEKEIRLTLIDSGPAFDPFADHEVRDFDVLEKHGMGIHIMTNLMSEVSYQRVSDTNQLTMILRYE